MTLEERLKEMILAEYKSVQNFANQTGIKYQTLVSILNRGVNNANIQNVFKICHSLGIDTNELADGKIIPVDKNIQQRSHMTDIDEIIAYTKRNLQEYNDLTIDGRPMTQNEIETLLDALDIGIGIIKRNRARQ